MTTEAPFAGLLGADIGHSLSPKLHSQWFREAEISAQYHLFQSPTEQAALARVESLLANPHFLGLNITAPFKGLLLSDPRFHPSPHVLRTGAANTLFRTPEGTWHLENTDIFGIAHSLEHLCRRDESHTNALKTRWKVVCLGAGGAAHAVPEALEVMSTKHTIKRQVAFLCRDPHKGSQRREASGGSNHTEYRPFDEAKRVLANETHVVVVNTLPLGLPQSAHPLNPHARSVLMSAVQSRSEQGKLCYFDMLYLPSDGLNFARSLGVPALGGALMLQEQGRRSFALWTGVTPQSNPIVSPI